MNIQNNLNNKLSINKKRFFYMISIMLYKISLDLLYIYAVSPAYSYQGFIIEPKLYKYVISSILVVIMIKPILKLYNIEEASSLIVLILNFIYFIPGCTLYALANIDDKYFLFFVLYWILLMFWQKCFPKINIGIRKGKFRKILFHTLIILTLGFSIAITGKYNGFKFHFKLSDVYDLRMDQREINLPGIVGYIQPLATIIIPISIVYFLINKKRCFSILLIVIQLLLFSFGGAKFTLFSIFVALLAYYFYSRNRDSLIAWGLIFLNAISIIESFFNNSFSYIAAYIQRRNFFIPNLLSYQYYDFFSNNELLFLRESILGRFGFESPYDSSIKRLIGYIYYGSIENNANNGMCGDAYSNFGWMGLALYPLIIIISLKLLDACSKNIDPRVLLSVCTLYAITFTNASFFQLLLTNGFLFICVFLYYYPRFETDKKENVINGCRENRFD